MKEILYWLPRILTLIPLLIFGAIAIVLKYPHEAAKKIFQKLSEYIFGGLDL